MMDQACYEDAVGCKQWHAREVANSECDAQANCSSCTASNPLCLWSNDAGCFMGAEYWGPDNLVVRHGETCWAEPLKAVDPRDAFLKPSLDPLAECMACVEISRSWQAGECNPSSECMIADSGCFQDALGCRRWHEEQEASSKCPVQKDCSSCLGSNSLCMWHPDSGCFVGSTIWGPEKAVFQNGDKCPEDKTLALASAEVLQERMLRAVKDPGS